MRRHLLTLALATGIAVTLASCGDDDSDSASTTSTSAASTTSSGAPSTSTPSGGLTPEQAAKGFYDAWLAGDSAAAGQYGSSPAIEQIFDIPSSQGAGLQFGGCEGAAGSVQCTWSRPGGQLVLTVNDGTGGGPVEVTGVQYGPAATTPTS